MTEGRYRGLRQHQLPQDVAAAEIQEIVSRRVGEEHPRIIPVEPVRLAVDRSIAVPAGRTVETGYVAIEAVILACRERMSIGDVERAFEKRLQLGDQQPWPCPRGHWQGDRFVIVDGRHEYVATLMLGHSHILVAWVV